MKAIVYALAVVFVIRYYAVGSGDLVASTLSFGWTAADCAVHKAEVEPQKDPDGTTTKLDCVEEEQLQNMLAKGSRT